MKNGISLGVVILAGGRRALNEDTAPHRPKLLEEVCGQPVLEYVLQSVYGISAIPLTAITTVISTRYEEQLALFLRAFPNVSIAIQPTHHGTADAVWQCVSQGVYPDSSHVLVLMGDQPLITSEDLNEFISCVIASRMRAGVLTFMESRRNDDYKKCAVVERNASGHFTRLRARTVIPARTEEELHAGPYLFEGPWLRGLLTALAAYHELYTHNDPEFHLYEALDASCADTGVWTCKSKHPEDYLGVDTLHALTEVRKRMANRLS